MDRAVRDANSAQAPGVSQLSQRAPLVAGLGADGLDQALHHLEDDILRMGSLAGSLIYRAAAAVGRQDPDEATTIIEEDGRVDAMHVALEQRAVGLLTLEQPGPSDLRVLASVLAIIADLEQIADHAESMADASLRLGRRPLVKAPASMTYMAEIVTGMLHDVLEAFVRRDPVLAEAVAAKDDTVDDLRAQIIRGLLTVMAENPRGISQALDLILVAQHLERAADRVTNVAERVVYIVTGEMKDLNPGTGAG